MSNALELKAYGLEPVWTNLVFKTDEDRDCCIGKAINWYNYMASEKEFKKWVLEYCEKYRKSSIDILSSLSADEFFIVDGFKIGPIARMLSLGAPIPETEKQKLHNAIDSLIEKNKGIANTESNEVQTPKDDSRNVQDFIKEVFAKMINPLEFELDQILTSQKSAFDYKQYITHQVKPLYCKKIIEHYRNVLDEYKKAVDETDPDAISAYSVYGKKSLKSACEYIQNIISECSTKIDTSVKTRKPRTVRKKPPAELVKKLNYCKEFKQLNMSSVLPSKIIGAQKLLVYNTKTETISLFEANSSHGLSVKGSTILHYDEKTSLTKKLRKPKEFFDAIKGKGIRAVKNALNEIKTKSKSVKDRINEDTILVEIY